MKCIKCGKEIAPGSTYCSVCGAKQAVIYQEIFTRKHLSDRQFVESINQWLQSHPKVANVRVQFDTATAFGLLVNQKRLDQLVIEYELFSKDNPYQYALIKESEYGFVQQNMKKYVAQWQNKHPGMEVMNWSGGVNSRGSSASLVFGGIGATNKLTVYMLVRSRREQPAPVSREVFCPVCGKKLTTQGAFCSQCGTKVRAENSGNSLRNVV